MSHACSYDERPAFAHLVPDPPVHEARHLRQPQQQHQHQHQHQQHQQQFQFQAPPARYAPPIAASASPESRYQPVPVPMPPPYFAHPHASLPSLNPALALSEPQFQPQWAPLPPSMPVFVPQSYNAQQNLQSELDVLSRRMDQVQGAMLQQGVQPAPAPAENGNGNGSVASTPLQVRLYQPKPPPQSQSRETPPKRLPSLKSDDYIDPTLFDADEVIRSHKFNVPESKYLRFQATGLFEAASFIKKDAYQTLYHLNLLEFTKDDQNSAKKHSGHFEKMINNPCYALEEYIKYDNGTLSELVKQIERKLPTKKVTWILLDLYQETVATNLVPIFDKEEFFAMLSSIIGAREETDTRTRLHVRVEDNTYIINLVFLLLALRLAQLTLICIRKPTEYQKNLIKASCASAEYDRFITILSSIVDSISHTTTIPLVKLKLLRVCYSKVSFDGLTEGVEDTPASLAALAMSVNVNNLSVTGDDSTLKQLWALIYFCYHHTSAHKGLPMLLTEDYFYRDSKEKRKDDLKGPIPKVNHEELELFNSVERILNKLNVFSSVLTLSSLDQLLKNYDDNLLKIQGQWKDFKSNSLPLYQKSMYTYNNFTHKQTKLSVISLILLHYEMIGMKVNAPRYKSYLEELCNIYVETFEEMYDVYHNFADYFPQGYEFMLYGGYLPQLDRLLGQLSSFIHRAIYHQKPMVSLIKFYLNVINDFETVNDMTQFFCVWKFKNRLKLVLHLWQKHTKGEIDLYKTTFEHDGETIDFKSIPAQHETYDEHTWMMLEKNFGKLNDRYTTTKYHPMGTVDELLNSIDFEPPHFNTRYFYSG